MKELKYNITKYGMKKLIEVEYKYNKEFKKNFVNRAKLGGIIVFILAFIIYTGLIYSFKKAIIYAFEKSFIIALGWTLIWILFSLVIKVLMRKVTTMIILKRMKSHNDKYIFVKFDNKNIEIKTESFTHNYILKKCTILFIDEERIYIKFSDNSMIYIPKDVFKDNNELDEFMMLFNNSNIENS